MNIDDLKALVDEIAADAPENFVNVDGNGKEINAFYISYATGAIVIEHDSEDDA